MAFVIRAPLLAAALLALFSSELGTPVKPLGAGARRVHEHLELTATRQHRTFESGHAMVEYWHAGRAAGTFSATATARLMVVDARHMSGTFRVHTRGGTVAFSLVGPRQRASSVGTWFAGRAEPAPGTGRYVDVTGRGRFRAVLDSATGRMSVDIETTYGPLPLGQHVVPRIIVT